MSASIGQKNSRAELILVVIFIALNIIPSSATIVFSQTPEDVLIAVGSQAQFTCSFSSPNAASVSWEKDGVTVLPSSRITINSTTLTINPTESEDSGTYSCIVTDQVNQVAETRSANLTFAYILDSFLISPETKTVMTGSTVSLFCLHRGSLPAATMAWVKDGTTLSNTNSITITTVVLQHANPQQTSSSISISPTVKGDSGSYECLATNSLLPDSPVRSSIAELRVLAQLAAPSYIMHPSSVTLISAGLTAVLECSASGEPVPSIIWQHEGINVNTSLDKITVTAAEGNSTLTITNVQQSDVGNYRCLAINSQGIVYSSDAALQIAFIQQSFQLLPQDTFGILGQDGIIECSPPLSAPPAVVSWFKGSVQVSGARFSIASNGSLLISSVEYGDEGDYICAAVNQLLDITRTSNAVHFSVYELPVITSELQDLQLAEGLDFTLICNATGVPMPQITWYKDDVQITSPDPTHLKLSGYQLTVYNALVQDEGNYMCVVDNAAGSDQANATIDVIPIPVITVDFVQVTVEVLSSALLPCHIQPDESITITWSFNGNPLTLPFPGRQLLQNGSLLIHSVAKSQEGNYICTATNSIGSDQGTIQLEVQVAPLATATQSSLTKTQGQTVQLTCTITGDPYPTVTWYHDDVVLTNPQLSNNDSTLTLSPVLKSHEGIYVCRAINNLGSSNDSISLIVLVAPSISASPLTHIVLIGSTVEFTCQAPGDPTPTVIWLTSNFVNVLLLGNSRLKVTEDNTLRIVNVTVEDSDQYICQATNNAGTASATVSLTVNELPAVSLLPYLNVTQGASVILDCQPTGSPTPSLMWYKNDVLLASDNHVTIVNGTVSISDAYSTDSGVYKCVAENIVGNDTASINLNVLVLPLILVPDPIVSVNQGSNAVLQCIVSGDPTPTLTWYFGSVPLPNPTLPRFSLDANDSLIVSNIAFSDDGLMLICQASNVAGTESATITINVNVAPNISALSSAITVIEGNGAVLSCTATGDPFPVITWYSNGSAITHHTPGFQYVSNGQTLVIGSVKKSNEGTYICEANNAAGTDEDEIELIVHVPPSFSPTPVDIAGIENTMFTLTCSVTGDPPPFVQWSLGGLVFPSGSSLIFSPLLRANAGSYTCSATNIAGTISKTIYLDVYYLPEITLTPVSMSIVQFTNVTFTCGAVANPLPQLSWLYNGLMIPGAQGSTYTIEHVAGTDAGEYTCVAQNVVGMVTSNATLTVLFPPSAPTVTLVQAISSSSLSVTWSPPTNDGGTPVISYIIEYRPTTETNGTFKSQVVQASGSMTAEITGLLFYTEYDVRMRAVNIAGVSGPSSVYTPPVQTHPAAPIIPANLTFTFTAPSTLTITWDTPTQLNGELGVYELVLTSLTSPPSVTNKILFVKQYIFTNILSDVTYQVQVRAGTIGITGDVLWGPYDEFWILNGMEVAQPSVTPSATMTTTGTTMSITSSIDVASMTTSSSIIPTTTTTMSTTGVTTTSSIFSSTPSATMSSSPTPSPLPTPPSIGPSNLILTAPDVGQITASWEIPGSGGNFDGFHIYISPLPPPESNISLPITVASDVVLYTISGLANSVSYNITIATYNAGGDGPSITRSIVTLAGPPGPPTNVVTMATPSEGEIRVEWSPPVNLNGILIAYHAMAVNTGTGEEFTNQIIVPPSAQQSPFVTVFNLPEGEYRITVTAENEVGIGPPSEAIIVQLFTNTPSTVAMTTTVATTSLVPTTTTASPSSSPTPSPLPTPPSIGPSNLILTAPDVGQITASWEIPGSGGNFDGFHIYLSPLPPPESNITLPITVGSDMILYTISGLANSVSYNVTIATYNAGGDGPSITGSIMTLAGPPGPPTNVIATVRLLQREIQVSWSPPINLNGILLAYHATAVNTGTGEEFTNQIIVPPSAQQSPFVTIFNLPEGEYRITITAENEAGIGPPSEAMIVQLFTNTPSTTSTVAMTTTAAMTTTVLGSTTTTIITTTVIPTTTTVATITLVPTTTIAVPTTSTSPSPTIVLPNPPLLGPINLRLFSVVEAQIVVSWEAPGSNDYDGFHIYLSPLPPPSAGIVLPITVGSDTTFYTINGLAAGVTYTVTVATYNAGGDGPSASQSAQTLGGVPGPPTNVEVIANLEAGSLHVTWGPPANPSGTLTSYQVVVTNLGNNIQLNESVPVSPGNQNANFNVLIMLQPAEYSVTVAAVNENGQGTPSEALNISLIIDTPSPSSSSSYAPDITPTSATTLILISPSPSQTSLTSSVVVSSDTSITTSTSTETTTTLTTSSTTKFTKPPEPTETVTASTLATQAPSVDIAAIVAPVVFSIIVIIAIVLCIIAIIHYRMTRGNKGKRHFKMSISQAEMTYELMPAPVPEKQEPPDPATYNYVTHPGPSGGTIPQGQTRTQSPTKQLKPHGQTNPRKQQIQQRAVDISQREAMEEPSSDEAVSDLDDSPPRQQHASHGVVLRRPHQQEETKNIQEESTHVKASSPMNRQQEQLEVPYIGEYATLDAKFMEVEPVQVPQDALTSPQLIVPINHHNDSNEGRPVKPVYDPGEYSYAELDQIRAKKAAERAAKINKSKPSQGVSDAQPLQPPQKRRSLLFNKKKSDQEKQTKPKKAKRSSGHGLIYEDQLNTRGDDDMY